MIYNVDYVPIPLYTLVRRNYWIFFSFIVQLSLPVIIYLLLYVSGSLQRVNRVFIAGNLLMLLIMYALFAGHVLSGLQRYKRIVKPYETEI